MIMSEMIYLGSYNLIGPKLIDGLTMATGLFVCGSKMQDGSRGTKFNKTFLLQRPKFCRGSSKEFSSQDCFQLIQCFREDFFFQINIPIKVLLNFVPRLPSCIFDPHTNKPVAIVRPTMSLGPIKL
jgi:hypothetical protein